MPRIWSAALVAVVCLSSSAQATLYHCQSGELVRRLELAEPPSPGFVCEVLYWKDSEQPGVPTVLWQARADAGYCALRASGLVDKLSNLGWRCAGPPERTAVAQRPAPAAALVAAPMVAPPEIRVARQPRLDPAERAVLDLDIGHTLASLRGLWPGRFDAVDLRMGDLDGDRRPDAAISILHQTEDGDRVHYLVAYLNRGASFQPAAVRNLSGRPGEVQAIELEAIARGQVIVMQTTTASGDWLVRQRTAFALADDQLVPAAPIAPPSPSGQRPQLAELLK